MRRNQSLSNLIQSHIGDDNSPGLCIVNQTFKTINIYTSLGYPIDTKNKDDLKSLTWLSVEDIAGVYWESNEMDNIQISMFLNTLNFGESEND